MKQSKLCHVLRASAAFMGFISTTPALAQSMGIGDIVVTARRVEERLQDVPISMTVLSQEQVTDRNIVVAADLAAYTPSLSVNQRYGPEKSSFAIRGFNQDQSTAPTVGVYFADVVGVRSQGGTTSGNTVGAGAFMDLQNVQVLKGPQGTLFGRNTTGGAILLVPTKPTGRLEGYIEGQAGNYNLRRVQAVVNVPVMDSLRIRIGAERNTRDGYMRNRSGIGPEDYNDVDYVAARFSIVADLAPNLENYTIVSYSDSDTNGYAARYAACSTAGNTVPANPTGVPPVPPGSITILGLTALSCAEQVNRQNARGDGYLDVDVSNPSPYQSLETWQIINTTTWQAADWLTVKNIMSYGEFRERANFNLYSDNFRVPAGANFLQVPTGLATIPFAYRPIVPGTPFQYIKLDLAPGEDNAGQSTATEEIQFQGRTANGRLNWVLGGYLEFSRPLGWSSGRTGIFLDCASVQNLQCANPVLIGTVSASRTKYDFDNHGIFAQASYKITDKLSFTLGGRYTFDKIRGQGESTRMILGTGQFCNDTLRFTGPGGRKFVTDPSECHNEIRTKSNKPTWLIGLDYKPTDDILLYGKYARGYRQGGISFTNVGLETWQPEKVESYEIGAKVTFRGKVNGFFNVAGFYNDFSNQQIFGATVAKREAAGQAGAAAIVNAGKSELKGVEVDASISPMEGLRLDVGYTYLDTKVKSLVVPTLPPESPFTEILPTAKVGDPLTLSPKNRVTVTGTYVLPLEDSIGKVSLSATFVHTDSNISNGSVPAAVGFLGIVPATDLLNVNVGWNKIMGSGLDAAFFMTNVTNQIYPVNTGGGYNSSGIGDWLMGQPRIWGFRLRYSFGQ